MISVHQAKQLIAKHAKPSEPTDLLLQDISGSVLARDVKSVINVPPFNNSAMDGYAFIFNHEVSTYNVSKRIQAGDFSNRTLPNSEAARIFTGAPLPDGTDTVIQQELISEYNGSIRFDINKITRGANVHLLGSQNKSGDVIAKKGSIVTPGMVGLFATAGIESVSVYKSPSVGIIITGNELQQAGTQLKPGHIYNANKPAIEAYLKLTGISKYKSRQVADDRNTLKKVVDLYLKDFDVIIITGGISVGDYDYVKTVLDELEVIQLFYKVKQKPGKPLFAGRKNKKWIFALPGNPAAALTCFNQYIKPCLLTMMGYKNMFKPDFILPITNSWRKKDKLTHFLKAKKEKSKVTILSGQQSYNMLSFNEANCFVETDESTEHFPAGTLVNVFNI
jgi:molybdopterin molybdotransferase